MTLIITLITPKGIWQSSDNRISINGKFRDGSSIKHVGINCPDGTALIVWTGLAELKDKTKISDWIRQTIRGKTRTVEQTLILITNLANQNIASYSSLVSSGLAFSISAYINKEPWYYEITNIDPKTRTLKENFSITKAKVENPNCFIGGSGKIYISKADKTLLYNALKQEPSRWKDYLGLLAAINKRVAMYDKERVSPSCITVFMLLTGLPIECISYNDKHLVRQVVPLVVLGIDQTESEKILIEALLAGKSGKPIPEKELQNRLEQAGRTSVTPKK